MLGLLVFAMLALKLMAPGEVPQIPAETLLLRLGDQLAAHGAGPVMFSKRRELIGGVQLTFTLPACQGPLRVVAISTQEDLSSAIAIATPSELTAPAVSVFAQGREYAVDNRLVIRLAAVWNYLALKFGLTGIAPSGTLLAVIREPSCHDYKSLNWPALWSTDGLAGN